MKHLSKMMVSALAGGLLAFVSAPALALDGLEVREHALQGSTEQSVLIQSQEAALAISCELLNQAREQVARVVRSSLEASLVYPGADPEPIRLADLAP